MPLEINERLLELFGIFSCRGSIKEENLVISIENDRDEYLDHVEHLMVDVFKKIPRREINFDRINFLISDKSLVIDFAELYSLSGLHHK